MKKVMRRMSVVFACLLVVINLFHSQDVAWAYSREQQLISEAWQIVDRAYVDDTFNHHNWWKVRQKALRQPLPDRDAAYIAIQNMLVLLDDPFTRLLRPQQYRSLQTDTAGELTGVGLQLIQDQDTGDLVVVAPIDGSPAQQAMIQSHDRIIAIDGQSVSGLTLDEAAERLRGPIDSVVVLTIRRGPLSEEIEVVRDRITLNPVSAERHPQSDDVVVGYIRLSQFNANATSELKKSLQTFIDEGVNAYLLDLRNNPGGLLQSGIDIARLWLDSGTILYTANRNGIQDSFEATHTALTDAPLAVLVNSGTASASEILSGALQDNDRAILVGEKTFGKGLIQSLFNLSDGAGLAVTIARYETPNHHDINKLGITPDRLVQMAPLNMGDLGSEKDIQYQVALDALKETLRQQEKK